MPDNEEHIRKIQAAIVEGADEDSERLTREAVEAGIDPLRILNAGLMLGADEVGAKFESGEFFLPELMLSGRALKAAMQVVSPILEKDSERANRDTGVVVAATVKSDIHDIGKNMVASMLTASGFEVTDLGVDVPIKDIIAKAQELDADLIACSALLTTSMPFMRDLVDLLVAMGERDRFGVMVGGASVTPEFAERIGADGTAPNAMDAVKLARRLIRQKSLSGGGT
jgi:corrinoid protein of di/trimethylamine methyltransferase